MLTKLTKRILGSAIAVSLVISSSVAFAQGAAAAAARTAPTTLEELVQQAVQGGGSVIRANATQLTRPVSEGGFGLSPAAAANLVRNASVFDGLASTGLFQSTNTGGLADKLSPNDINRLALWILSSDAAADDFPILIKPISIYRGGPLWENR